MNFIIKMTSYNKIFFYLILLIGFILFSNDYSNADVKIYSFGVVPQFDVRQIQEIWQPILKYLSEKIVAWRGNFPISSYSQVCGRILRGCF